MDHVLLVQVLDAFAGLEEEADCFSLCESGLLAQVLKEVSFFRELHEEEDAALHFEVVEESDDVGMQQLLVQLDLALDEAELRVWRDAVAADLAHIDLFEREQLIQLFVSDQLDCAGSTFAQVARVALGELEIVDRVDPYLLILHLEFECKVGLNSGVN